VSPARPVIASDASTPAGATTPRGLDPAAPPESDAPAPTGLDATSPGALDDAAWDAFVAATPLGSYLQLAGWASVKAVNGWRSIRVRQAAGNAEVGAQVLVQRPRPLPWGFAYAPRGPVATGWGPSTIETFTAAMREGLQPRLGRVSHVRIDPEVERDGPDDADGALRASLRSAGWRPAPAIQPGATRIVDLQPDEDALWGALRRKWRQYVNKARSSGITVVDAGADRLPDFYRIYRETADRAGFPIRTEGAYRDIWDAYAPAGLARLLFAQSSDGMPLATLFLVRCGPRVVEPYGGMTGAGADSRANYLLKWEAIRSSRASGATSYDMWGMVTPGIARFKAGFGGREVEYIGAWDLVLDGVGRSVYGLGQRGRVWLSRRRRDLDRRRRAGGQANDDADDAGG
jgi:lipid II:glycine glycyltransferase (peptidoglycan interpeptide bridge formation enzyme)